VARAPVGRTFPASSAIERAVHDPETQRLDIRFAGGDRYSYFDVPDEVFDALCAAESAGEFVNRVVKPNFRCEIEERRRRFRPRRDEG
jgi:hypothetical protein